jgi:hypothetical protein
MEIIAKYLRQRPKQRSYDLTWLGTEIDNTVQSYVGEPINEATIREIEEELRRNMSVLEEVEVDDTEIEGDRIVFNLRVAPPQSLGSITVTTEFSDARPP